jgi:hypothetical protein
VRRCGDCSMVTAPMASQLLHWALLTHSVHKYLLDSGTEVSQTLEREVTLGHRRSSIWPGSRSTADSSRPHALSIQHASTINVRVIL